MRPTWPVAAGSLVAGFAIAELTGVRPVGGIALVAGLGWCALRWRERHGAPRAWALASVYLVAFALSHLLGRAIGAWPAVAVAALAVGLVTWRAADAARAGQPARPLAA